MVLRCYPPYFVRLGLSLQYGICSARLLAGQYALGVLLFLPCPAWVLEAHCWTWLFNVVLGPHS